MNDKNLPVMTDSILEGCKAVSLSSQKKKKKLQYIESQVKFMSRDPKVRERAAKIDPMRKGRTFSQSGIQVGDSTASKITRPSCLFT